MDEHEDAEAKQDVGKEEISPSCLWKVETARNGDGECGVDDKAKEQVKQTACVA